MKKLIKWPMLFALVLLFACGGGGGGGGGDSGPSDNESPFVVSSTPTQGEISVHPDSTISVVFNEPLNPGSITKNSIILECDSVSQSGTVNHINETLTFTPAQRMPYYTDCIASVSGVEDEANNPMASDYKLHFRTMSVTQLRPVLLSSISPAEDESGVFPNTAIIVYLKEDVDPLTVNATSFRLSSNGVSVSGSFEVANQMIKFTPDLPLDYDTPYTVTLVASLGTLSGATLESDYSWVFTIMPIIGTEELVVSSTENVRNPALHVDGTGTVLMVWGKGVHYLADYPTSLWWSLFTPGSGWSTPSVLVDAPTNQFYDVQLAGNTNGERFLYWMQSSVGPRASRFDPVAENWENIIDLTDISGYGTKLAMGENGNAILANVGNVNTTAQARAKRYDASAGWQSSETLEPPWTWGGQMGSAVDATIDNQGNALIVWAAGGGYPDPVGLRFNRYTNNVGWTGMVELDSNISANRPNIEVDGSGNAIVLWYLSGNTWAKRYQPSLGWAASVDLGQGNSYEILFDSSGNAMVLLGDSWSKVIKVANFSSNTGWGTTYRAPFQGIISGWLGNPGTRAVALVRDNIHLWRITYSPGQYWEPAEAIFPYTNNNLSDISSILPDGTGVVGWTTFNNSNWELGVIWFP